jgi:colanic acid biosynthesis glycosyl transferase WcaI
VGGVSSSDGATAVSLRVVGGTRTKGREAPARGRTPRGAAHPVAGRNVLIVGINYAPEPTGIAPYTTGMAEHLAHHAASVTVLTGVPHYPTWRVPDDCRLLVRRRERGGFALDEESQLVLRRLRHYVPSRQTALTRASYELTFLLNAVATRTVPQPDLVVSVTPSLGGAVAAAVLAKRYGAQSLVVVQDLMAKAAGQSGISGGGRVSGATGSLERWALRRADRVAIVSDAFRGTLHDYGIPDERIALVPNWVHIERTDLNRGSARRVLGWPAAPFTVVHTGNIGLKQDLGNVVAAARLCMADTGVRFVIVGDGSQRAAIQAQAAGLTNLVFVDPLDAADYPKALAAADVLLVNERPSVGDMSLPSKLTSYLVAGRPVLAAVAEDGATARELSRTDGAGQVVPPGDPAELAKAVLRLRDDRAECARMGTVGRRYAAANLGKAESLARLDAALAECGVGR